MRVQQFLELYKLTFDFQMVCELLSRTNLEHKFSPAFSEDQVKLDSTF